jgi:PAS domain S-box-containing protein
MPDSPTSPRSEGALVAELASGRVMRRVVRGRYAVWATIILTGLIFVLDCLVPREVELWLLYLLPLSISIWAAPRITPRRIAVICTVLLALELGLATPRFALTPVTLNRAIGVMVIWGVALLLTRHLKAEQAMWEGKMRMRLATAATGVGVWEWDLRTNRGRWDAQMFRLYGVKPTDDGSIDYTTWSNAVRPEDLSVQEAQLQDTVRRLGSGEREFRIRRGDGKERLIRSVETVRANGDGQAEWVVGTNLDITDLKDAEAALRNNERAVREMLDNVAAFVGILTPGGITLEVNRLPLELARLRREEVVGKQFADAAWWTYSPVEQARVRGAIRRAAEGETVAADYRAMIADGVIIDSFTVFAPLRGGDGKVSGVVASGFDVTERKRAEAALLDKTGQLQAALKVTGMGVWSWNFPTDEVRAIDPNGPISRLLATAQPTVAAVFFARVHPEDDAVIGQAVTRAKLTGDFTAEFRFVRPDGEVRWISCSGYCERDAHGVARLLTAVDLDVTARVRAEAERQALTAQLLRAEDNERRRIARELHDSTAQHLAAIRMNLAQLPAAADPAVQRETLALVERVTEEVRTVSYLLHPPLLEALGLVGALRDYAAGFARRSGIRAEVDAAGFHGRLSPEAELAFFRVVQESLSNIHRHSASPTALIRLERDEREARLEVQDAGHGLPAGAPPQGGGVGLAGMRERMRLVGGRLEVESDAQGVTVLATLPVGREEEGV